MSRKKVAIIGGGITGLCAARALARSFDVELFEKEKFFGGKCQSVDIRGHVVDIGPDAFITRNPAAVNLTLELGLGRQLISPSAGSAAVYARGALRPFPKGLAVGIPTNAHALSRSGIVSYPASIRALFDRVMATRVVPANFAADAALGKNDPSVAQIVGRRLGKATLSMLVDPLVGGIYASDVEALSFAASLPQFVDQIAGRRSLMGALRHLQSSHPPMLPGAVSPAPSAIFQGVSGGLSRLVDALIADCRSNGVALHEATAVHTLMPRTNGEANLGEQSWTLQTDQSQFDVDAVVLAVPAFVAAQLVESFSPSLKALCEAIVFSSVTTITGVWRRQDVVGKLRPLRRARGAKPPTVTDPTRLAGVLIPRRYGHLITAVSFTSSKWPASSRPDEFIIRCSAGRHGDDRTSQLSDEELIDEVCRDLQTVLGLSVPPVDVHIARWPSAFPQYTVGHLARIAAIDEAVKTYQGLEVAGASYHGIGIPACIDSAGVAVQSCASYLSAL